MSDIAGRKRYRARLGPLAAAALTAVGGLGIGLGVAQSSERSGHTLIVAYFLVVAPTLAIARMLPTAKTAVALIVGAAGSVAINALVVQSMLSANAWSPRAGVVAVGLIAALLWLVPTSRPGAEIHHFPPSDNGDPLPHRQIRTKRDAE
ncbi:hypothetical protein [Mycobacterium sp. JS623]|uniref:hypothetical protein n=1 Tax=Mycobacterium sp. JS623 TaxID=212767 RepID=UPI001E44A7ED|nr:hypothetical protein [Mycobacterium sp. JS623]